MLGRGSRTVGFPVSHMVGPTFADIAQGVEEKFSKSGSLLTIITTQGILQARCRHSSRCANSARAVLLVGASRTGPQYGEASAAVPGFCLPHIHVWCLADIRS